MGLSIKFPESFYEGGIPVARTYLSQLVAIVYQLCKYTTKYGPLIVPVLDSPEKEVFQALVAACNSFMASTIPAKAKAD